VRFRCVGDELTVCWCSECSVARWRRASARS
jgi:hypothetical protein